MNKEIIFQGTYLTLSTEERIIDGERVLFESVEACPSVHVIPIYEDGDILLIDEQKIEDERRRLRVMAGMQDQEGEDALPAAQREAQEEMGIVEGHWEHFYTASMTGTIQDERVYFVVRNFSQYRNNPHTGESIYGTQKISLETIIPEILDGQWGASPTPLVLLMLGRQQGVI